METPHTEFDIEDFQYLQHEAQRLHAEGDFEHARESNVFAYTIAPEGSTYRGMAARDIAAQDFKLGEHKRGAPYAWEAYTTHSDLVNEAGGDVSRDDYREAAASGMVLAAYEYVGAITPDSEKLGFINIREAWENIRSAEAMAPNRIDRVADQFKINIARRRSALESMSGNRKKGLLIGAAAVALSVMSESPRLDTSDPDMMLRYRLKAKGKALIGSGGALLVAALASPEDNRRRRLADKITRKLL